MVTEKHNFQPGNGTAYHLLLVDDVEDDTYTLVWLRYVSYGPAFKLPKKGYIHYSYLQGKLPNDVSEADTAALLLFINNQTSNEVGYHPSYNNGLYSQTNGSPL
jgi:hypothetical protein